MEGLLKHKLQGPSPEGSVRLNWGLKTCVSNHWPGDADGPRTAREH